MHLIYWHRSELSLAIHHDDEQLHHIAFITPTAPTTPINALGDDIVKQLDQWYIHPHFAFNLPLKIQGSPYRQRVWQAISNIPYGKTRFYSELARDLNSHARAIGQACGDNPWPIIVPCHRVLAKQHLGGFNHSEKGYAALKLWLLKREQT